MHPPQHLNRFWSEQMQKGVKNLARGWKWHKTKSFFLVFPWASSLSSLLSSAKSLSRNACLAGWSVGWGDPRRPARMHALHFNHLGEYARRRRQPFLAPKAPPHSVIIHSLPGSSLRAPVKSFRSLPHACLHILAVLDAVHERSARVCHQSYVCFHNSLWAPNAPQFNWLRNRCWIWELPKPS